MQKCDVGTMIKTQFISSRTRGVNTASTPMPNHLAISVDTQAHSLACWQQVEQIAMPKRWGLEVLTLAMEPSHLRHELMSTQTLVGGFVRVHHLFSSCHSESLILSQL
jgi:hypothetical protein